MKKILGMGNSLVDILIKLDDDKYLTDLKLDRGSMTLVDKSRMNGILDSTNGLGYRKSSGGSAANTINGLAILGAGTGFIGKVGDDEFGLFFDSDMKSNKINTTLFKGEEETGKCVVLISKDSERTMATYLGAAIELCGQDLTEDLFIGYDFFHVEGYFVQDKDLLNKALEFAKKIGLKISIDLSSYNIVEENREYFKEIVAKYVDILFANEEEAEAFTEKNEHKLCLMEMGKLCKTAVLKLGKDGSMILKDDKIYNIKPVKTKAIDTTGAGDLFAAGFFYGLVNEYSIDICGQIGALLGKNAVEVVGARMNDKRWDNIRAEISKIVN